MLNAQDKMSVAAGTVLLIAAFNVAADFDSSTGEFVGNVAAHNFSQYCRGDLPAERISTFETGLQEAEAALAAGNPDTADNALRKAWEAAYRGDAYNDMGVRCLGEQATRRWINVNVSLWRTGSGSGPEGIDGDYTGMYVAAVDGGTEQIVTTVSPLPAKQLMNSVNGLRGIAKVNEGLHSFGALVLAEENRVANASRTALPKLEKMADEHRDSRLHAEEIAFTRSPTAKEMEAAESMSSALTIGSAITGADLRQTANREAYLLQLRVTDSQNLLREARAWDLRQYENQQANPASKRALQRGEVMLKKGDDVESPLNARDSFYAAAEDYFKFALSKDRAEYAAARRATIQPALQAEKKQMNAELEKAAKKAQGNAAELQQAVQKMQKTDAEKQSFKTEADAMEAELGF